MTCHDAREQLSALLDEALEADRRVEVEAHLAGCAECRFELDRLRATVGALHGLERPRAPIGFVDRVMERVQPAPWYRRLGGRLFLPLSIKLPAAAATVVIIAGLATLVWERTPEFHSVARQDFAIPSAPPTTMVEPTSRAPAQSPSAPAEMSRPSEPPRARSEERPPSFPAATDSQAPSAPAEPKAAAPATPTPESKPAAPPAPETKAAAPPAPAAKSESEVRARSATQTVRRTLGAAPSSDLAGRLIVRDRAAAVVSLVELVSKIGGYEIGRRQDADSTVIDVQVPAASYDEFVRGLDALGSWTAAGLPNVLPREPPQIRLTIRVSG